MRIVALGLLLLMLLVLSARADDCRCGNKGSVRSSINSEYQNVFWGDEIDIWDYGTAVAAVIADIKGGGGTFSAAWIEHQISRQIEAIFGDVDDLDASDISRLVDQFGSSLTIGGVYVKLDVATFKNEACTNKCCVYDGYKTSCSCTHCGMVRTTMLNTHQPYLAIGKKTDAAAGPQSRTAAQYHSGCQSVHVSKSGECVAATKRFCSQKFSPASVGYIQQVGLADFGVACIKPAWYGDVSIDDLRALHSDCSLGSTPSSSCMAAIHRWCSSNRRGGAGFAQEVGSGVVGVACFDPIRYEDVRLSTLTHLHGECNALHKSQTPACVAAVNTYCRNSGNSVGGLAQEVGTGVFGVACFPALNSVYTSLPV